MTYDKLKLVLVAVIALAVIVALVLGLDPVLGVPVLTLLVGYIVGNARVTNNAPIVERTTTNRASPPKHA